MSDEINIVLREFLRENFSTHIFPEVSFFMNAVLSVKFHTEYLYTEYE